MFEKHPLISTPSNKTPLWRYLTIEKFLALLTTNQLYFCRADRFKDSWEGILPDDVIDAYKKQENSDIAIRGFTSQRQWMFMNCWHSNSTESAAMWDIYSQQSASVAILSSVERLKRSIERDKTNVFIGEVKYINYKDSKLREWHTNLLLPFFLKRESFAHEREVRALIMEFPPSLMNSDWDNPPKTDPYKTDAPYESKSVAVNLQELINSIYVSPMADKWIVDMVTDVVQKFDISASKVVRSPLYDPKIY